ncbi:hypothetical protein IFM89_030547, partial [Coptis chinensis]
MASHSCFLFLLFSMISTVPPPVDLRMFHRAEVQLFNRIVGRMKINWLVTKKVMSLWFCLEEVGYAGLLEKICLCDDKTVKIIFKETTSCFHSFGPDATEPRNLDEDLFMSGLVNKPINRGFIYTNRDIIFERTTHFLNTICNVIFDKNAAREVDPEKRVVLFRDVGECSRSQAETSTRSRHVSRPSSLDPFARPFYANQRPPRDQRTMFLTFSDGYPLCREEIIDYFTKRYGDVVEEVIMEETREKVAPKCAKIVFRNVLTIPLILGQKEKAKFCVNGKQLWARMFIPRTQNRTKKLQVL